MHTILIVEPVDEVATALMNAAESVSGATPARVNALADAAERINGAHAVVVLGPSLIGNGALETVASSSSDTVDYIAVAQDPDTDLMRRAMKAGVRDVIPVGAPLDELSDAVAAAIAESAVREPAAAETTKGGKIVTVFSTKGGVGKSVLSTNIATVLGSRLKRKTALVDLDLQFGDVGILMGLKPTHTIYDAVQAHDRLDEDMMRGVMTKHSSGVDVLLAPTRPEDAESVTANRTAGLLELLRRSYEFVVVDTAPAFTDITLTILDLSDLVYIVTMMDVASIKNTRVTLQKLQQLGYDPSMMRLVLNRADSKVLLNVSEVEKTIGATTGRIPSDLLVPRSVNKGVPVVTDAPRSKVAKSISMLADDAVAALEGGTNHVA